MSHDDADFNQPAIFNIEEEVSLSGAHFIVVVFGPSGAGKTRTLLRIARGLVGPDKPGERKIGLIDTETGRGRMHRSYTQFAYGELTPPFTPDRHIAALDKMDDHGFEAIGLDSGSHVWDGEGGVLDMADQNGRKGLNKWLVPKQRYKKFVRRLLRTRTHIFIALRAREKFISRTIQEGTKKGQEEIVSDGYHPICERDFIYEATISILLLPGERRMVVKCPGELVPVFGKVGEITEGYLGEEAGRAIRDFLGERGQIDHEFEKLRRRAYDEADKGMAAYQAFWKSIGAANQSKLLPEHENLKSIAAEADDVAANAASAEEEQRQDGGTANQTSPPVPDTSDPTEAAQESEPESPAYSQEFQNLRTEAEAKRSYAKYSAWARDNQARIEEVLAQGEHIAQAWQSFVLNHVREITANPK